MVVTSTIDAKDLVKNWMDHRKVFEIEVEPTPSNLNFHYNGKSEGGIGFIVMQPKAWETSVLMMAEVKLGETHLNILKTMRQKDRDEFISRLMNNIIFAPASFAFDPTYSSTGFPQSIQFSKEICFDNLTEDRLSNSMRDVVRCVIYIIELFKREFGEVKEE
jgi:hypothetical protein